MFTMRQKGFKRSIRDLEGKTVHSSISLNSCTPTCSVPCSNPHCAKMSPCFAQAKITWGTPVYATQSIDYSTVRTRYFPEARVAALMAFSLALLSPFTSASPHTCHSHRQNWGLHHKKPSSKPGRTPKKSVLLIPRACMVVL